MRFAVLILFFILHGAMVEAQIDPSSAMLLNTNTTNVRDGGLDSGRYTVKPRADVPRTQSVHKEAKPRPDETTTASRVTAPTSSSTPIPTSPTAGSSPSSAGDSSTTTTGAVTTPNPSTVFGPQAVPQDQEDEDDEPVVAKVPRDERRFTMLELSFAPGYLYNDSQSTFAPRNYFVNAPTMSIEASVWTSPNFGVHTSFNGTLNANVTDSLNNTRNASLSEQWFSAGAHARKFFGDGALAPTLQFGVDYREFDLKVPSDTLMRNKLTTTGLFLLVDTEIPTSCFGAWVLGGEFGPKLSHHETSNATEFRTGDDPQTTSVGVHIGGRYRFDHTQTVFWKASYGVEKNLFSGTTSINDPITGLPETNVSVTQTYTLFQLGYTWGN